jgi:hypothetical protein
MSLYRVSTQKLEAVNQTSFITEGLLERKDLQRLLRNDIRPIGDDLMVIAEEYGDWEESSRRIDLLCLSKEAGLVVVEIKRTEDGGHMELQAIRYAAMVANMTLEQVIDAYGRTKGGDAETARKEILEFLESDSEDDLELIGQVRIVLVSGNFSTELTTSVLWLNQHDLDITCIRLRPYKLGSDILVDATQIIPLPEAEDYAVKVRAREKEKRKVIGKRQEALRKFWSQLIDRSKTRTALLANRTASTDHWLSAGLGRTGFGLSLVLVKQEGAIECYIRLPGGEEQTLAAFNALKAQKESIETAFGGEMLWQDLPGRQGCRISSGWLPGGWTSPESEWAEMQERMIDALIRFEHALKQPIQELKI